MRGFTVIRTIDLRMLRSTQVGDAIRELGSVLTRYDEL